VNTRSLCGRSFAWIPRVARRFTWVHRITPFGSQLGELIHPVESGPPGRGAAA
jgi:hypothetical protein